MPLVWSQIIGEQINGIIMLTAEIGVALYEDS